MKLRSYLHGYAPALRSGQLPEIQCHILASKYTPGGEPVSDTIPLEAALLAEWDYDVHFTQYTSPDAVRATKGNPPGEIRFDFCAFDMDYQKHRGRPTDKDFARLMVPLYVQDHTPNLVYQTRGGVRLVYLIKPLTDPEAFEGHYAKLMAKLAKPLSLGTQTGYELDQQVKDWTRLFRAPHVVRDGQPEYGRWVGFFHDELLDLSKFKFVKKPGPNFRGDKTFTGRDRYLFRTMNEIEAGQRNCKLFAAFAYTLNKYTPDAAAKWVDIIGDKARSEGLDDHEIESVYRSACRTTGRSVASL